MASDADSPIVGGYKLSARAAEAEARRSASGTPLTKARPRSSRRNGPRAEYDGATFGRRATGWKRRTSDANAELNPRVMSALRGIARQMVRNNPYAASGVRGLANYMVGTGITFQVYRDGVVDLELTKLAREHFDSTKCDAEGRNNFYGLQLIGARAIVEGGAVLIRRRWRRAKDRLPVPFQLQLLEPDYIDMSKQGPTAAGGHQVFGIEFDVLGARSGYWLYSGHPGATAYNAIQSKLVPAHDVAHCFRVDRPEQQHGATWFAPVILRMNDFADYEDAQLVRQKLAACFVAFRIGAAGDDTPPETDSNGTPIEQDPLLDQLEPGIIEDLDPEADVKFANPPSVEGYGEYSSVTQHGIATGLGLPYEVLTGDMKDVSFISGRLRRLDFRRDVQTWQWQMLIPQLCEPAGQWFLEAAEMQGIDVTGCKFKWTPPKFEMMDPANEVPAIRDAIRSGQQTISGAAEERGEDPDVFLEQWAADAKKLDDLGLIFDSDPRKVTQVGNSVQRGMPTSTSGMMAWLERTYPGNPGNRQVAGQLAHLAKIASVTAQVERARPGDDANADTIAALVEILESLEPKEPQ